MQKTSFKSRFKRGFVFIKVLYNYLTEESANFILSISIGFNKNPLKREQYFLFALAEISAVNPKIGVFFI